MVYTSLNSNRFRSGFKVALIWRFTVQSQTISGFVYVMIVNGLSLELTNRRASFYEIFFDRQIQFI